MNKKLLLITACLLCTLALHLNAQDTLITKDTRESSFFQGIRANQEESYITFGGGLGNIDDLIFEALISPYFLVRTSDDSRYGATIAPALILRMYAEESFPVRTPSYMPHVTFYRQLNDNGDRDMQYVFLTLAHHSNGQDDDFFLEDGSFNTKSGDFATNYVELGASINKQLAPFSNTTEYFETSLEYHFHYKEELENRYSFIRWNSSIRVFRSLNLESIRTLELEKNPKLQSTLETSWLFGDIGDADFFDFKERFNISFTLAYQPDALADVSIFLNAYSGKDYYNMNFNERISVVRVGLQAFAFR